MRSRDVGHLKSYTELIARKHGGLAGLLDMVRNRLPAQGLELEGVPERQSLIAQQAASALEAFHRGDEVPSQFYDALEAIIDADLRPVIDVVDGKFTVAHPLWTKLTADPTIRQNLESAMGSIGRLELPGDPRFPYGGTAFLVGEGLLMTNRHVAEIFATGLGTRTVVFRPNARAGIDYVRELNKGASTVYEVRRVVMIHPYWDMALLAVDGPTRRNLQLSLQDARELVGHEIAVIGYPFFDPRNPADVQQDLFAGHFGIKRLQPGELQGGGRTLSFHKTVEAATHDCSTTGGNSGSALLDLATGLVLGLHFGGTYKERNYAVPAAELARDARVADAGVQFGATPSPDPAVSDTWWRHVEEAQFEGASETVLPST